MRSDMENNSDLRNRIKTILAYLNQTVSGKDEALRITLLSAVAGEGILLLGSSGLDKSTLIRCVASAFSDFYKDDKFDIGNNGYFEYFMNESSQPDDLIKNSLSCARIAFFDDIWASSPAVLNTLISFINDRKCRISDKNTDVPLIFAAAGSTEADPYNAAEARRFEVLRESFALHVPVNQLASDDAFFKFVDNSRTRLQPNEEQKAALIGSGEIRLWQPVIDKVEMSDDAKSLISDIRKKCFDYYISDFRWKKIIRILKTCAFLNGRNEVDLVDCSLIDYAIPNHVVEDILKQKAIDCKLDSRLHDQYKANIFARHKYYKILRASIDDTKLKLKQKTQIQY